MVNDDSRLNDFNKQNVLTLQLFIKYTWNREKLT